MTQQDKELLLIDLCGRLPYYPYALFDFDKKFDGGFQAPIIGMVNKGNTGVINYNQEFYAYGCMTPFSIEEFRIYLRPMSSMTDEEIMEFSKLFCKWHDDELFDYIEEETEFSIWKHKGISPVVFDWLNCHHFDYRGLIPKSLALEAPKDMYKID